MRQDVAMYDEDPGPVVQRLVLGGRLRALRETRGVGLDAANTMLGWYRGKLSKVEGGTLGISERELSKLLDTYGVTGFAAAEVRQLGQDARRRAAPERVSDWAKQYVSLERAATEIRMVYAEIPGLLQTRDCAKEHLYASPVVLATDVEQMAVAREERGNQLFRPNAPRFWAILGEEALHRVGPPAVRSQQLARLGKIADLPNVTIRIVPMSAGPAAGLSCPFTLLWVEPANAKIAYVETLTGADYLRNTDAYSVAFDKAEEISLTPSESRSLIERLASGQG